MSQTTADRVFDLLTAEDDGRVCRDIPDAACKEQPRNFLTHVAALTSSKLADGLIDPKLVLSWLLTHLGAPAFYAGLLVPVRESGALAPQLFTAGAIRSMPRRKWAWAGGAAAQGLFAIGVAASALALEGAAAGVGIVACLAGLALARSVCSVSYKDVLGKTVDKARRGAATGLASSLAAGLVIAYGLLIVSGLADRYVLVVCGLLAAGGLWIAGAAVFATLAEDKGATEGGGNPIRTAIDNLSYLSEDAQLRRFIAARGLLISTALAPPFMVSLAATGAENGYGGLGLLLIASSGAALVSGYVWGRLADRSSRKVLILSALAGAGALAATVALNAAGLLQAVWALPAALFGLMIAYQGVRLGRSTHLVDMTGADRRAAYTAISNTAIGLLLIAGGGFSLLAAHAGEAVVIGVLAAMSLCAAAVALGLEEAQAD